MRNEAEYNGLTVKAYGTKELVHLESNYKLSL